MRIISGDKKCEIHFYAIDSENLTPATGITGWTVRYRQGLRPYVTDNVPVINEWDSSVTSLNGMYTLRVNRETLITDGYGTKELGIILSATGVQTVRRVIELYEDSEFKNMRDATEIIATDDQDHTFIAYKKDGVTPIDITGGSLWKVVFSQPEKNKTVTITGTEGTSPTLGEIDAVIDETKFVQSDVDEWWAVPTVTVAGNVIKGYMERVYIVHPLEPHPNKS